ncbi:uncharacterized protein LOC129757272 [Uranotaenia lowii]|uniref:uncharacterized protein LOC129757272 n=1 Tax=Uranotaenia lowii TaxID=190385 RepID=UPI002478F3F6|nr:uncharacterized protein LOC129757272 [Uranotaenia lowii]
MKVLRELLVFSLGLAVVVAIETTTTPESSPKDEVESRGRKRFYRFLLRTLTPLITQVGTLLFIKAKIVALGIFLVGIYFFGHKIWPGGFCGHSGVFDSIPPFASDDYTPYHASGPEYISSYPGPPEHWSASYPGASSSSYSTGPGAPSIAASASAMAAAGSKRRGRRDVGRQEDQELLENEMYWTDQLTELGFRFLGVDTRACRKRFVCEFDFHSRQNPILLFVTRAMGRDIFHNYRDASDEKARSYRDCGRIYAECAVPKRPTRPVSHRRKGLPTTTTTEEPEEQVDQEQEEAEHDQENEIDRSFGQQTEWRPIASDPVNRLILRRYEPKDGSTNQKH